MFSEKSSAFLRKWKPLKILFVLAVLITPRILKSQLSDRLVLDLPMKKIIINSKNIWNLQESIMIPWNSFKNSMRIKSKKKKNQKK